MESFIPSDERLKNIEESLAGAHGELKNMGQRVDGIDTRLNRLSEDVSFLLKAFDRSQEEAKRHREVMVEMDIRAFMEIMRPQAERLDDHEQRIVKLEEAS